MARRNASAARAIDLLANAGERDDSAADEPNELMHGAVSGARRALGHRATTHDRGDVHDQLREYDHRHGDGEEEIVTITRDTRARGKCMATPQTLTCAPGQSKRAMLAQYVSVDPDGEPMTVDAWPTQLLNSAVAGSSLFGTAYYAQLLYEVQTNGGAYSELITLPAAGIRRRFTARQVRVTLILTVPSAGTTTFTLTGFSSITGGWVAQQQLVLSMIQNPLAITTANFLIVPRFATQFRIRLLNPDLSAYWQVLNSDGAGNVAALALSPAQSDSTVYDWTSWPGNFDVLAHNFTGTQTATQNVTAEFLVG